MADLLEIKGMVRMRNNTEPFSNLEAINGQALGHLAIRSFFSLCRPLTRGQRLYLSVIETNSAESKDGRQGQISVDTSRFGSEP